jgi:hypothetical protein
MVSTTSPVPPGERILTAAGLATAVNVRFCTDAD